MEIQTHKKDFSMQMWNPYRKTKKKYAVQDSPCAQRKQHSVKCLCRQPDSVLPFNYAASSRSIWQILKDVTSWSELNPTLPRNDGQWELTFKTVILRKKKSQAHSLAPLKWMNDEEHFKLVFFKYYLVRIWWKTLLLWMRCRAGHL